MKYINLAGPVKEIDRVIETYISNYEIQLEYAAKELYNSENVEAFTDPNPYVRLFEDSKNFTETAESYSGKLYPIQKEEAENIITRAVDALNNQKSELQKFDEKRGEWVKVLDIISHFANMHFNIEDLAKFKNFDCVFGKIPLSGFMQFEAYLYNDANILFEKFDNDGENVWCVYFTPKPFREKVEAMFSSLHFEPVDFPADVGGTKLLGTPEDSMFILRGKIANANSKAAEYVEDLLDIVGITQERMAAACRFVSDMYYCYECRKYAGKTSYGYFMFMGWMSEGDALRLSEEVDKDEGVVLILETNNDSILSKPPTKLKNNVIFRPFEFLIRMYGVPSYGELDPTPLVAITYSLFFGMMFGDVGQGAVLSAAGFLLYKFKKMALGSILGIVGISSVVFGFLYGSIFGFEDILHNHLIKPAEDIMQMVMYSISLGAVTILVCMGYSIANAARKKQLGKMLFDSNGVAGMLFYVSVIACALAIVVFGVNIPAAVIVLAVGLPLAAIAFKEPLTELVTGRGENGRKHKKKQKSGGGMGAFVTVMELVEVILSFFTNTLSFVRIAGYAICHAGLMSVVMMLSGAENGSINFVGIIIGNAFVMALEGLIVFIQTMRLQYYEMFSRYYEGGGKELIAYKDIKN
jgi:V/A-type H+-transporting ATPase subunit I